MVVVGRLVGVGGVRENVCSLAIYIAAYEET